MHLTDRCRRDRHRVETDANRSLDRSVQFGFDHLPNLLERERRYRVLQQRQFGGDILGHQIGASREQLTELDEGRAELVQELSQVPAQGGIRLPRGRLAAHRPSLERIPKPMPSGHPGDLASTGYRLAAIDDRRCHAGIVPVL